jgi:hypothetical protein
MQILRTIWQTWKKIGRLVGDVVGRIFLTLFYFTILVPFAFLVRLLSDPLHIRAGKAQTYWLERLDRPPTIEDARRQF